MIIEITVTKDDYTKFCKFAVDRISSPKGNKNDRVKSLFSNVVIWLAIAFVSFSIFQSNEINFSQFHWPSALITTIPFLVFISTFLGYLSKVKLNALPNENGLMLGERTIEIDESGIRDTNSFGTSLYKWKSLHEVAVHKGNVYLFLDTMLAQIIPSSAFENEDEAEEFKRRVEIMHNEARQPTADASAE